MKEQLDEKAVKSKCKSSPSAIKFKCGQGQAQPSATAVKFSEVKSSVAVKVQSSINQVQSSPCAVKSSVVVQVQSSPSTVKCSQGQVQVKCI